MRTPVLQKMRRMIDFIREFKFGRPQQIAALLLLAFITLVVPCALRPYHCFAALGAHLTLPSLNSDGIIGFRLWLISRKLFFHAAANWSKQSVQYLFYVENLSFLSFGISLAGALWWVTRRLYSDLGGYVALTLFCFSLPMILHSSVASPDVVAA